MEERKDGAGICFNHLRELLNKNLKGLRARAVSGAEHSITIACFLTELETVHI